MRIEYSIGEKKYYLEVDIRTIKEKEGIGVHMDNTAMLELCYVKKGEVKESKFQRDDTI